MTRSLSKFLCLKQQQRWTFNNFTPYIFCSIESLIIGNKHKTLSLSVTIYRYHKMVTFLSQNNVLLLFYDYICKLGTITWIVIDSKPKGGARGQIII